MAFGRRLTTGIFAALLGVLCASSAFAQSGADPSGAEDGTPAADEVQRGNAPGNNTGGPGAQQVGVGTRVQRPGFALTPDGKSRLHLGIDAGAGFDTNPYSVPNDLNQFNGDVVARIRPRADVNYEGSLVNFTGQGLVDYGLIPGLVTAESQNYLLYQSLLGANLEVNRGGLVRFAIGDTFTWNSDPGFVVVGSLFNRIQNNLRAGVGLTPGGGALSFRLGYDFMFAKYIDIPGTISTSSEQLDNMTHSLALRGDYKFLPKTGLFVNVIGGWNSYVNPFRDEAATPTSFPLTTTIGIQGQILAKLAGMASVGYSNPFVIDEGQLVTGTVIGAVGQAEIQWLPTPTTRLGGGFQRTFAPAPLYQYFTNNRFYFSLNQLLAGRFQLNANLGYSILEFGEEQVSLSSARVGRLDGHLDGVVGLAYFFTDWMSLGISNNLDWRVTNAEDPASGANFGFLRNQTLVLASLRY